MAKKENKGLDFEVDNLTNSIKNIITGDSFQTEVSIIGRQDLKIISGDHGWLFDWVEEFKSPRREVYKLTIIHNSTVIQGLLSIEIKTDHVYMHLLENAPFNKGRKKVYSGVAGNLVAFACKRAFQLGFDGNVSFLSKSTLIKHYEETLDAFHLGGRIMIIGTKAALKLMDKYFKSSEL